MYARTDGGSLNREPNGILGTGDDEPVSTGVVDGAYSAPVDLTSTMAIGTHTLKVPVNHARRVIDPAERVGANP